jgi:hypothetical protein
MWHAYKLSQLARAQETATLDSSWHAVDILLTLGAAHHTVCQASELYQQWRLQPHDAHPALLGLSSSFEPKS